MNSKILILATFTAMLCAACTEKAADSAANPPDKQPAVGQIAPVATSLTVTPKLTTLHTVGRFEPTTTTMVAEKGQAGALMYGPYAKFAIGHYQATFHVTAESDVDGAEVGVLDVNGYTGAAQNSPIAKAPLKTANGEQVVKLTFDVTDPLVAYEFRVFVNGKGNRTIINSVQIEKL